VAADDLSAPLGQHRTPKQRRALPIAVPQAVVGLLGLFVAIFAGWAMVADDPFGGEPMAVVPTDQHAANAGRTSERARARPIAPGAPDRPNRYDGPPVDLAQPNPPAATNAKTVTIIDGSSGKRQEIVLPGTADTKSGGIDQRLTESSRHGPLPKVAPDGSRPSEIYARQVKAIPGKPNAPRVAIVIGGLGIGASGTSDALGKLPPAVTFAFAPYAGDLERIVGRSRSEGHEVLLQVPMEPFDYPDNDPGPQTLLTSLDASQNIDRLQWLMSRFHGYVGIVNAMGARFTASDAALAPVLREAGKRGLLYLDDGSSQRSLAGQIAGAHNLPFAKADLTIDAVPSGADVDRALGRLETMARERGIAVGMASALPASIERIAKWTKAAEGRGVLLVPISAVAMRATEDRRQTTENRR
jgi:polysaccharide deacetylase 2 family uncharacterized protein YibQ